MAGESKNFPKKYWWVVLVALPVVLALIAIVPQLMGGSGEKPSGANAVSITGNNNTVTIDNSSQMTVINNISVIAQEYQKYTGQALVGRVEAIDRAGSRGGEEERSRERSSL